MAGRLWLANRRLLHFTHVVPAAAAMSNWILWKQGLQILVPGSSLQLVHILVVSLPHFTHVVPAAAATSSWFLW